MANSSEIFQAWVLASPNSSDSLTPHHLFRIVINGHSRALIGISRFLLLLLLARTQISFLQNVDSQIRTKIQKKTSGKQFPIYWRFLLTFQVWGRRRGNLSQGHGGARISGPCPPAASSKSSSKLKCSECKMSVFSFWSHEKDEIFMVASRKFCGCNGVVCSFAPFFRVFLRSF